MAANDETTDTEQGIREPAERRRIVLEIGDLFDAVSGQGSELSLVLFLLDDRAVGLELLALPAA